YDVLHLVLVLALRDREDRNDTASLRRRAARREGIRDERDEEQGSAGNQHECRLRHQRRKFRTAGYRRPPLWHGRCYVGHQDHRIERKRVMKTTSSMKMA